MSKLGQQSKCPTLIQSLRVKYRNRNCLTTLTPSRTLWDIDVAAELTSLTGVTNSVQPKSLQPQHRVAVSLAQCAVHHFSFEICWSCALWHTFRYHANPVRALAFCLTCTLSKNTQTWTFSDTHNLGEPFFPPFYLVLMKKVTSSEKGCLSLLTLLNKIFINGWKPPQKTGEKTNSSNNAHCLID